MIQKTKLQQLPEGNVELKPVKQHRRKNKTQTIKSHKKQKVPQKTGQQTLIITRKQRQTNLTNSTKSSTL